MANDDWSRIGDGDQVFIAVLLPRVSVHNRDIEIEFAGLF
jgi:hypothetical protein